MKAQVRAQFLSIWFHLNVRHFGQCKEIILEMQEPAREPFWDTPWAVETHIVFE